MAVSKKGKTGLGCLGLLLFIGIASAMTGSSTPPSASQATNTPTPVAESTPTATPSPSPTPSQSPEPTVTPSPSPTAEPTSEPTVESNTTTTGGDKDCGDFKTQAAAQAYFESKGGSKTYNADKLDGRDGDGVVCESLP